MKLKSNEILVYRDVCADMTSYDRFAWPKKGHVEAPDWEPTYKCGHGLHGLPWGVGGDYRIGGLNAKHLIVKVSIDPDNYRSGEGELRDKCKFRSGEVVFCGSLDRAIELIQKHVPVNTPTNWVMQKAGYRSTQTAGDMSTQTAGDMSTQTAGDESTQTAGDESTQKAGYMSTQTAGYRSTQTAGYRSTQTAGDMSTQTAGDESTQTAGDESTQKAGYMSTQTAGYESTQTAGYRSTQTAGDMSTQTAGDESTQTAGVNSVQIQFWYEDNTYKVTCRTVTEKEANKPYICDKGIWNEVK